MTVIRIPLAGSNIIYEPVGVVAGVVPWNFPLMVRERLCCRPFCVNNQPFQMAAWKIGPSLAAGCTVIIKPSEFTPFSVSWGVGRTSGSDSSSGCGEGRPLYTRLFKIFCLRRCWSSLTRRARLACLPVCYRWGVGCSCLYF
jgi:hypothetical protein